MRLGIEAGAHTYDVATEHGIQGVPISAQALVTDGVQAALAPLKERGLQVCQIGAFGYNPLHPDAARLAEQRTLLERTIPLAAETGCRYITVCGGNYHPSGFGAADPRNFSEPALDAAAREFGPLCRLAERHGAILTIEAYLKTAVGTPAAFLRLQDKVGSEALRCNLDVTSLYAYADVWDPMPLWRRTCMLLGPHCGLIHIKEVALLQGFHIHMGLAPLGDGPTDWAEALSLMAPHLPADSWAIVEHVKDPEEARASLSHLRAAGQKAGVTLT